MGRRIDLVIELAAALANLAPAHRELLVADSDEGAATTTGRAR